MPQRKKPYRYVALYYRDEDKVWRKINARVYIANGKPTKIFAGDDVIVIPAE